MKTGESGSGVATSTSIAVASARLGSERSVPDIFSTPTIITTSCMPDSIAMQPTRNALDDEAHAFSTASAGTPTSRDVASVVCPGGTYVIGGGVKSAGFWAETVINTTVFTPGNPTPRWTAFADNHAGVSRALTSYVVCSEPLG